MKSSTMKSFNRKNIFTSCVPSSCLAATTTTLTRTGKAGTVTPLSTPNSSIISHAGADISSLQPIGLSVHYLKHILLQELLDQTNFNKTHSLHDIENLNNDSGYIRTKGSDATCPKDGKYGVAFIDCDDIHVKSNIGPASIYLSCSRDTPIQDIADCLWDYCKDNKLNPKNTFIWIDLFCMNLHRIVENRMMGVQVQQPDSYRNRCEARIKSFKTVVSIFKRWKKPLYLSRMRCLFEMITTLTNGIEFEVLLPAKEKEQFVDCFREHGAKFILDNYYSTKIQDGMLEQSDGEEIMHLLAGKNEAEYAMMNFTISDFLRKWCMDVLVLGLTGQNLKSNYVNKLQEYLGPVYRCGGKLSRGAFKSLQANEDFSHLEVVEEEDRMTEIPSFYRTSSKVLPSLHYSNPSNLVGLNHLLNSKSIARDISNGHMQPIKYTDLLESTVKQQSTMNLTKMANSSMGISIEFLQTAFIDEVKNKGYDPFCVSIYGILEGIIKSKSRDTYCPKDGKRGAAYIDCLHDKYVGVSNFFLSYCWAYRVGYIVASLSDFCKNQNLDPAQTYLWMDCFCVNQHRMAETNDSMPFSDLRQKFESQVLGTGHVLAMMLPWYAPLYFDRAWCLFEIYTALEADVNITVLMSPSCNSSMMNLIAADGKFALSHLYRVKAEVDIESAQATSQSDLKNILKAIKDGPGYANFNNTMGIFIERWVVRTFRVTLKNYHVEEKETLEHAKFYNIAAHSLCEKGQHDHSVQLFRKSIQIHERVGKNKTHTAIIYNNLGCVLHDQGNCDEALKMHKKALGIREKHLGSDHHETASSYNNVGCIMLDLKRVDDAKRYLQNALEVYQKVFGPNSPYTASILHNIGCALLFSGELSEALDFHEHALQARLFSWGRYHPSTASSYQQLSDVFKKLGDGERAAKYKEQAIDIRTKTLGLNHAHTRVSRDQIRVSDRTFA